MNEWYALKARYTSNKQYENRKVLLSRHDFEDFTNWLVDQGAEILATPKQDEALRFKLQDDLGLVYGKGSGNKLAHDLGRKYDLSNKKDVPIGFGCNVRWGLAAPKSVPSKATTPTTFEYCFFCKELQELNGDQCSVCHSHIKF